MPIPRTRSLSNESIDPNVRFNFYFDVNDNLCFGVIPESPNRAVIKGAGAAGLVYPGAARALLETYKLKSVAGASAGACTAVYIALGFSMDKFEEISRNKDLSTIEEVKHYNNPPSVIKQQDAKTPIQKAVLKPLHSSPINTLSAGVKTAYKVAKGVKNIISKKHGIFSGKKIAEEVNADICEHAKKQLQRILTDIKDEKQLQETIELLQVKGPLKDFHHGKVRLKTFEDVIMNDHLPDIIQKIPSLKNQEEITKILAKASLRDKKSRLKALKKIKSILHSKLEENLVQEFENALSEFAQFEYLLDSEVLTFGQFKYLLKHYPQYDFRCQLYIEVANRTTKQPELISHETDPHLPIGIATQMSMSIPIVFKRVEYKECEFEDGGVQANCPWKAFDSEKFHPLKGEYGQNLRTIGLYRANPNEMKILHTTPPKEKSSKVMNMFTSVDFKQTNYQNKLQAHQQFPHRTVLIPDLVKTADGGVKAFSSLNFKPTESEKNQLIQNGYSAVKQHTENYQEGALTYLKFSSIQDLMQRQAASIKSLQEQGAHLTSDFSLLTLLEQKLADKTIPTDTFFPRGPSTRNEREVKRQQFLAEVREVLHIHPAKHVRFFHPCRVLPKIHYFEHQAVKVGAHYKIRHS